MKDKSLFSIVICVDERVDLVLPTIKSIYQQTYPQIEVLVYYCNPDLNENPLITPLQKLPIRNNIRVCVEKSDTPIRRADGIRHCMNLVSGDAVIFTKENVVLPSVDAITTIMNCFEQDPSLDAMLLPNTLNGPIETRAPFAVLSDQLLFNQPKRLPVFRTDVARELLNNQPEDVFELLPERMLLCAEEAGRNIVCCPNRKATITQKAIPVTPMNHHLYKRDALLLLDEFFLRDILQNTSTGENEKLDTYYAKLNYYCALYSVPKIETAQEIKKLEITHLRKKYEWYRDNYLNTKKDAYPDPSDKKKQYQPQPKHKIFSKLVEKINQACWQIGSILLLALNFLIIIATLAPSQLVLVRYVLFGGWIVVFALFVYARSFRLQSKLQKFKTWLYS